MIRIKSPSAMRRNSFIAALLIAGGLIVSGISLKQLSAGQGPPRLEMAQVTQPDQAAPSIPPGKAGGTPAESKPGGSRPTTPAPEPARPDADAQKAGAVPALPAAPAEKIGEPLPERK